MKILLLGHGKSNDGVKKVFDMLSIAYDYFNPNEVKELNYSLVVKSPGMYYEEPIIKKIKTKHLPIVTDIEVLSSLFDLKMIAVTGTNGKTTTVSLIKEILGEEVKSVTCGNIGYSFGDALMENDHDTLFILELSSFELVGVSHFHPHISVITNLSSAHLDYHKTLKNYQEAKLRIIKNQTKKDFFLLNLDDPEIGNLTSNKSIKRRTFSICDKEANVFLMDNIIYLNKKEVIKLEEIKNYSVGFIYDVMIAILVASIYKVDYRLMRERIIKFKQVRFRFERITSLIFNDAKSTNVYSTINALSLLENNVILICGGYERKENLEPIKGYLGKIKYVLTYGETGLRFKDFFNKYGIEAKSFQCLNEAIAHLENIYQKEVILYSPMCASYDQYDSYLRRGEEFNNLILESTILR